MKLLKPGVGDVIDRLSILAHKVVVGRHVNTGTRHWEEEIQALETYADLPGTVWEALLLAAVNSEIWSEMDLDEPRGTRLKTLNLERARMVAKLNGEPMEKEKL